METTANSAQIEISDPPALTECVAAAVELRQILREEAEILGRFSAAELLWLIPKKELSVGELGSRLESFKSAGGGSPEIGQELKSIIREIDELNRSNGLFIQKTLSYWQDFLSIFSPPGYGPAGEATGARVPPPKGLAFRREV